MSIRRILDIAVSFLLLIVLLPLFLLIGLLIKVTSPGPIFFKQKRIGYLEKIFVIWKFRTMFNNSHTAISFSKDDERITSMGKFLRPTHLDELPQLWNILKGDMGFVGPRPKTQKVFAILIGINSDYKKTLRVKPGITGITQIKNRHWIFANLEKALRLELQYAQNKTFRQDLKIIILTIPIILKRKGV